jgi:hypothetical protein
MGVRVLLVGLGIESGLLVGGGVSDRLVGVVVQAPRNGEKSAKVSIEITTVKLTQRDICLTYMVPSF